MRLRPDGRVAVIEANPNPWLASKAEFAMAARKAGRTYTQLVGEIVELALARYGALTAAGSQPCSLAQPLASSSAPAGDSPDAPPAFLPDSRRRNVRKRADFRRFSLPGAGSSGILMGLLISRFPSYSPYLRFGGHVTFQVGDKVIYPNHGLGVVQGIETKTILGTTCGFYHLRMVANETTVLVPVDNVDGVGLRRAIGDEEIERLFGLLGDGKIDNHQNWKGRFKDNSDRMRTGSIYDVVEVLKSLTFLAQVEEPLVPREAHARSREVPRHLGDLRGLAREDRGDRREGRPRARALLLDQDPVDRPRQGRQGRAAPPASRCKRTAKAS